MVYSYRYLYDCETVRVFKRGPCASLGDGGAKASVWQVDLIVVVVVVVVVTVAVFDFRGTDFESQITVRRPELALQRKLRRDLLQRHGTPFVGLGGGKKE